MTGSRRGPEPRISQEAVLAAAKRLPPDRLTMRALGRELGVTHGAIYRYYPDLKSVLAALGADLAEALRPPSEDLPWQEWLRETARTIRQIGRQHPEVGTPVTWPVVMPAAQRMIAEGVRVLGSTFAPADALTALGLVSRVADSYARSEVQSAERPRVPLDPELEALLADADLPSEGNAAQQGDAAFERELDIVIAGLEVTLPKRS